MSTDELKTLVKKLNDEILPFCKENKFSLHKVFEYSRENDTEMYKTLSKLWSTYFGKELLRSAFRSKK